MATHLHYLNPNRRNIEPRDGLDANFYVKAGDLEYIIDAINDMYDGFLYQGVIDCSGNPNYPAGTQDQYWRVSVAGLIGGASGVEVEVGDEIICINTTLGGTQAAVGADFMIIQRNLQACTIAELRLADATTVYEYVNPYILATQLNAGASPFSAATILSLSGGTTEQLKLTHTAAQKALTIAGTVLTANANPIDITSTVNSANVTLVNASATMSAALSGGEIVKGSYFYLTSHASDADTSSYIGQDIRLTDTGLSRADLTGLKIVIDGNSTATAGTEDIMGIMIDPSITLDTGGGTTNFYGIWFDGSGITNTTSGATTGLFINAVATTNDLIYGADIHNSRSYIYIADRNTNAALNVSTVNTVNGMTGGSITVDTVSIDNTNFGLSISKDLANAVATGAGIGMTNEALKVEQNVATSALADSPATANNNLVYFNKTNTTSIATADVYGGDVARVRYFAGTTGAGTATTNGIALNIDYDISQAAGTLTVDAFGIINVDFDITGTPTWNAGTTNLVHVNASSNAASPAYVAGSNINGTTIDLSAMIVTDADLTLYGLNVVMPVTYGAATESAIHATGNGNVFDALIGDGLRLTMAEAASIAVNVLSDVTGGDNAKTGYVASKDITLGAGTGPLALTNSAYVGQFNIENTNNGDAGDQLNSTANVLELTFVHDNNCATVPSSDAVSGTALKIGVDISVQDDANSVISSATTGAIFVDYNLTEGAAGVLTVDDWNGGYGMIGIDYDNTGTTAFANGVYRFFGVTASDNATVPVYGTCYMQGFAANFLALDASDATLSLLGFSANMPASTGSAVAGMYIQSVVSATNNRISALNYNPAGGADYLYFATANIDDADNAHYGINISKDMNLTAAAWAAFTMTNNAAAIDQSVTNINPSGFGCIANNITARITNSHTMNTNTVAAADTNGTTALSLENTMTTTVGTDTLTYTGKAMAITYALTANAGIFNYDATDVINVNWDVAAGVIVNAAATAGAYITGMHIDANGFISGATLGASTIIAGHLVDFTSALINDANANLYAYKAIMPTGDNTTNAINSAYIAVLTTAVNIDNNNKGYTAWCDASNTVNGTIINSTGTFAEYLSTLTANQAAGGCTTSRDTNPIVNLALTTAATNAADVVTIASGFQSMSITTGGAGTTILYGDMMSMTLAGTNNAAQTLRGYYLNGDTVVLNNGGANFYGIDVDISGLTNTASADCYGARIVVAGTADGALNTSDGTRILTLCGGAAHLVSTAAMIFDMPVTAPGAGFNTAGGVLYIPHGKKGVGGMLLEEIFIDLHAAAVTSKNTADDIIGEAAGGAAYYGQITAALNGAVQAIEVICVEVPAGGDVDIDFYSAVENTGVYDDLITGLTETQLINAGGNWTLGMVKAAAALPAADEYLYLASGSGGVAGAYTAGKFIIRIYGA